MTWVDGSAIVAARVWALERFAPFLVETPSGSAVRSSIVVDSLIFLIELLFELFLSDA
jgi:hypothetical protein